MENITVFKQEEKTELIHSCKAPNLNMGLVCQLGLPRVCKMLSWQKQLKKSSGHLIWTWTLDLETPFPDFSSETGIGGNAKVLPFDVGLIQSQQLRQPNLHLITLNAFSSFFPQHFGKPLVYT